MKRLLLALPILVAACKKPHEATSGKEFLEKFKKASQNKDAETLWKMMSKRTQEAGLVRARASIETAKKDPDIAKYLRDTMGIADPANVDPTVFAIASLKKWLEAEGAAEAAKVRFIEEKKEGDLVIVVSEQEGKGRDELVLVTEDGYLKLDSEASGRRSRK
jgi:hypothetical protein